MAIPNLKVRNCISIVLKKNGVACRMVAGAVHVGHQLQPACVLCCHSGLQIVNTEKWT